MNIEQRPINEIKPYPKNAKKHINKQIKQVAASISEFGFNQPIVVDKDNVIIVGHGRFMAAQKLGLTTIPVLTVELDEEKAKAYRLADNKLNESDWDMDLVVEELKTLSIGMADLTGFDINLTLETQEDKPDLSKLGEPKSKLGDVYELGRHRLVCGDSTETETYNKLMREEKAHLIFTDPPYSVDYVSPSGMTYNSDKYGGNGGRIFNDDKSPAEALIFYKDVLKQLYDFSIDDTTIYWWFASRLTDVNMQSFRESGWRFSQIAMWLKNSIVYSPGQLYHRIFEPCMIGWKEGHTHYKNTHFPRFSELWTIDNKNFQDYLDMWYQKRDNTSTYVHPTQKPVQLAERALKRSSQIDDIVLDAFGGSGSTLIACEQLQRSARIVELDPKYVDVIVERWIQFSETTHVIKNGEEILW